MAGRIEKTKDGLNVWVGGIPTEDEFDKAPFWTIFGAVDTVPPGTSLPDGPGPKDPDYPLPPSKAGEDLIWWVDSYEGSYYPGEDLSKKSGIPYAGRLIYHVDHDMRVYGDYGEHDAWQDAIRKGWTLVKAPLQSYGEGPIVDGYDLYTIDDLGERFPVDKFYKTRAVLDLQPASSTPGFNLVDLDEVNRHRARMGRQPINPADGWTPKEISEMAANIRSKGTEYNPSHGKLKRKLMR